MQYANDKGPDERALFSLTFTTISIVSVLGNEDSDAQADQGLSCLLITSRPFRVLHITCQCCKKDRFCFTRKQSHLNMKDRKS